MLKVFSKMFLFLILSLALIGLSGCADKENTTKNEDEKKTVETSDKKEPQTDEKKVTDLVLENTKIVKVSNIAKRTHELYPDLGPFFVIRGMDIRGQVSEVWINDMKIFEMGTSE